MRFGWREMKIRGGFSKKKRGITGRTNFILKIGYAQVRKLGKNDNIT